MEKQFFNYLQKPYYSQILLELNKEDLSAKKLSLRLPIIPPATLYRYVKKLHEDGMIKLVSETKIRGAIERIYTLSKKINTKVLNDIQHVSPQRHYELFASFTFDLINEFNNYAKKVDSDVQKDGSTFMIVPVYTNSEELKVLSEEVNVLLEPLLTRKHSKQKKQNIAIIISPPSHE